MKIPSISLKRTLEITMNNILLKIKELDDEDSQALIEEYKEWLEVGEQENNHPYILYMKMNPNS
tara:strand:- start:428 stop:619 length:192 start_codon:yes stop_codon:yes gene_type:complete